jgi:HD-GYP domain-containing protein (c-di-GMP phosphodiesterase class II)
MSRIVNVADAYDAMITRRPYNNPRTQSDAVAELRAEAGRQFDPQVVEAFLDAHIAHA